MGMAIVIAALVEHSLRRDRANSKDSTNPKSDQSHATAPHNAPTHDVWLQDALIYVMRGTWPTPDEPTLLPEHEGESLDERIDVAAKNAATQLRQLAHGSHITIWGRPKHDEILVPIPRNYWVNFQFHELFLLGSPTEHTRTEPATGAGAQGQIYYALKTNKKQVEKFAQVAKPAVSSREITLQEGPWPDFKKWDILEEYTLSQSAWLWCDHEPKNAKMPPDVWSAFKKLESALMADDLRPSPEHRRNVITWRSDAKRRGRIKGPNVEWKVTKAALKSFAIDIGEKPRFLFPEERI